MCLSQTHARARFHVYPTVFLLLLTTYVLCIDFPLVTFPPQVLRDHFHRYSASSSSNGTRAIVFTQARASVEEIIGHIKTLQPMCKVGGTAHCARATLCSPVPPC